jgi:prepilin-type N-terminal cleavage/methylation domain-containing protein
MTEGRRQKSEVSRPCRGGTGRVGFTLIELLVVIAIIMMLAGMLFSAFTKARLIAKRTRAKTEMKQLDVAWRSMLSDYRTWALSPARGERRTGVKMSSSLVHLLDGTSADNDKGIVYMQFDSSSTNSSEEMVDPWYREGDANCGDNIYWVALGDNDVSTYSGSGPAVPSSVAVWSKGPNGAAEPAGGDDVRSWDSGQ